MDESTMPARWDGAPLPEQRTAQREFSREDIELLKQTVAKGVSDAQLKFFLQVCKLTRLDPFARQIYAIPRGGQMTIQVGIDGVRLIAERTGKYAGQLGPFWCGGDGDWREVWLESAPPRAAKVGVLRKDFAEPLWGIATWTSYAVPSNSMWQTKGDVMLAKCAESLALRKAFPQDLSALYTDAEMDQADTHDEPPAPAMRNIPPMPKPSLSATRPPTFRDGAAPVEADAASTAEPGSADVGEPVISDEQRRTLIEVYRAAYPNGGKEAKELREVLSEFGIAGTRDIPASRFDEVMQRLHQRIEADERS